MPSQRTRRTYANRHNLSLSAGYSSHRSSRVTNPFSGAKFTNEGLESWLAESSPGGRGLPIEILVEAVRRTNLPGPLLIVHEPELNLLGRGSQFVVYKSVIHDGHHNPPARKDVAIKAPTYQLDPNIPLSLASPEAQKHLHDIYLEVLALTNPTIHEHPNVVQLLGWGVDVFNFHRHFYLVTELAYSNLREFFGMHDEDASVLPVPLRNYDFCNDIAAGLDVLHNCGLIHGDLKPDNILMFPRGDGTFIARLADFGLSISEAISDPSQARLGGTVGWQAPEVEEDHSISNEYLLATDIFSFGLLIWSIMLRSGKTPPTGGKECRRSIALRETDEAKELLGTGLHRMVRNILDRLLNKEPSKRPTEMEILLGDWGESENELSEMLDQMSVSSDSSMTDFVGDNEAPVFNWEPHIIHDLLSETWLNRFKQSPESIPVESLFGMFLVSTDSLEQERYGRNLAQNIVQDAAVRGSKPAQGVIATVLRHIDATITKEVSICIPGWLRTAVASGSILARKELENTEPTSISACLEIFRATGGYAGHYCSMSPWSFSSADHTSPTGYSHLHWLATFGPPAQLIAYLESGNPYKIDETTDGEETPLYLACARGSWERVEALLDHGADPTIQCTSFNISCLHWLFAFDDNQHDAVVSRLLACGADLDALAACTTPFLHYPFVLPSGTALHWAVAVGAHKAIETLIRKGADVRIRDGSDPYVSDRRVREQMYFGGPNMQAYSKPSDTVQGLSPLDYAAMNHDSFIFELLAKENVPVDINTVDEEGLSVLHRISVDPKRVTRNGQPFSDLVFRGSAQEIDENLRRTISAVKSLGGDLELLTKGVPDRVDYPGLTPLMMASLGTMPNIVKELLVAGAYIDTENNLGNTALMCISEDPDTASEVFSILVEFGANVNHRSKFGMTPIIYAARFRLLEVVDLLVLKGVDITETYPLTRERAMERGKSLFSFFASKDPPFQNKCDVAAEKLLEKHVFSCPNAVKRRQVIECAGVGGWTLLHDFAIAVMPRCVRGLVANGAPVNARLYRGVRKSSTDVLKEESGHETPLDLIVNEKRELLRNLRRRPSERSLEESEDLCQRMDTVIAILKSAGGISASHETKEEPAS
ncbi:ankyrin [Zopfia rhizophila CBS 207.26]|uniref:Ankyrin n=1 Tax=Zopfia rhizophila CBS 207.26 TaxID=1314779 RepID=A0A6A6DYN4_9PEZI|nr:ankyrin [Zopfia rhizophila CBS 207.26]